MKSTKKNLDVLYEDNHLIVVNKRVGDIVQGDKTGDQPLSEVVGDYIAEKYNKPGKVFVGVVHRLDRPTSGAVVFARTSKALERMNKMLRERKVDKIYWAVVNGHPEQEEATLVHHLKKNSKNNKSTAFPRPGKETKRAVLHYSVLCRLDRYTLLEITLETGRHHQIRSQLAAAGHAIRGDLKYGFKRPNRDGGIHLHARKICFLHPVKRVPVEITAPLPSDSLWSQCEKSIDLS
jgi:23S rRNA pseudouridine1911/1915/1917 synthase